VSDASNKELTLFVRAQFDVSYSEEEPSVSELDPIIEQLRYNPSTTTR